MTYKKEALEQLLEEIQKTEPAPEKQRAERIFFGLSAVMLLLVGALLLVTTGVLPDDIFFKTLAVTAYLLAPFEIYLLFALYGKK